ncbi:MAG: hypothetical protein IKE38_01130 [Erysipelotrichaceae bacterium]|nr:hypothetical protein [Erysipelotrichaceae bacterium]
MKKLFRSAVIALILIMLFPSPVKADMGPKPSVHIAFEGIEGSYYVTLLSKEESFGPYYSFESEENSERADDEIFSKFLEFARNDDYYFVNYPIECSDGNEYAWTYYPPEDFKVLIYLADSDRFMVTDPYTKYAFDSYYRYDLESNTLINNYNYRNEALSLFGRVILTIVIEVLVALLFKYKKHLKTIIIVNIITQGLLNLFVNVTNYYGGLLTVIFTVFVAELAVLIIETVIYRIAFKENKAILYAIVANILSFIAGSYIALIIPGLL